MNFSFSKYSGCGNDFILIDNRSNFFPWEQPQLIQRLCHRQNGIGADGIILLENSQDAHFKMRIFNSDGSEAEMCGNGIRCLFKFIQECGIPGNSFNIETSLKILNISMDEQNVAVEIGNPSDLRWNIELNPFIIHHLDTGVPHTVSFVETLEQLDVKKWGPYIRNHQEFTPKGTNANFASIDAHGLIHVRTYERGVENETLACGTGATATALAAAHIYNLEAPLFIKVRSGDILKIDFRPAKEGFTDVRLIGPVTHVFKGEITGLEEKS